MQIKVVRWVKKRKNDYSNSEISLIRHSDSTSHRQDVTHPTKVFVCGIGESSAERGGEGDSSLSLPSPLSDRHMVCCRLSHPPLVVLDDDISLTTLCLRDVFLSAASSVLSGSGALLSSSWHSMPRSATFTSPRWDIRKFPGFKSLCNWPQLYEKQCRDVSD